MPPPLLIAWVMSSPISSPSTPRSSTCAIRGQAKARASRTASPTWSPWPCVTRIASTRSGSSSAAGQDGFPVSHGSTYTLSPAGVSKRKAACPSQVSDRATAGRLLERRPEKGAVDARHALPAVVAPATESAAQRRPRRAARAAYASRTGSEKRGLGGQVDQRLHEEERADGDDDRGADRDLEAEVTRAASHRRRRGRQRQPRAACRATARPRGSSRC